MANPIKIKEFTEDDEFESYEDEINTDEPMIDEEGEVVIFEPKMPNIIPGGEIITESDRKLYVSGVNVTVLNERIQYLDGDGKLITSNLKDYTRMKVRGHYQSLSDFLNKWNAADKKHAIIEELTDQGIVYEDLKEEVNKAMDIFDMICHTAFDQPPMSRADRAKNVKKRNYFTKYGEKARAVLDALLDKYADEGIENIENMRILQVSPLSQFGTPHEIVELFGGKQGYMTALNELEREIYRNVG